MLAEKQTLFPKCYELRRDDELGLNKTEIKITEILYRIKYRRWRLAFV